MLSRTEEQKKEIETIRERNISVKLSDADCERIAKLCGEHDLKVGELLGNFIMDLVGGTYTNGSDERMYARNYFERCWFGMFPEKTLLNFLLGGWFCDVEDFLDLLDNIQSGYEELENYKNKPEEYDEEEIEYLKTDIIDWEQELMELKEAFRKKNEKADWEEEVKKVKLWFEEMEKMRDE